MDDVTDETVFSVLLFVKYRSFPLATDTIVVSLFGIVAFSISIPSFRVFLPGEHLTCQIVSEAMQSYLRGTSEFYKSQSS